MCDSFLHETLRWSHYWSITCESSTFRRLYNFIVAWIIFSSFQNNILKILRFKTLLLISLVILALSLAWTSLNHERNQPYKTETMISLLVSIVLEIYFFMVIDVLAQNMQESTTRVLPPPSPSWRLWGEFDNFAMPLREFLLIFEKINHMKNIIYNLVNISWHLRLRRKWI